MYFISHPPSKTAGTEKGTNHQNIFHRIYFLKTAILEAELIKVPIVNEKGTTDVGKSQLSSGIKTKLAPPPQIALIQNAAMVAVNSIKNLTIIFF